MANCSPSFITIQYINNRETKRSHKGRFISKVLIFLNKSIVRFKIIRKFVEVERNFYKTFNKSASINTNQVLLSCNRLELSPWSSTHVFKKIATTLRWNSTSKALLSSSFSPDNGQTSRLSIFYCIPNHKNVIPKYLKNVLTDSAETSTCTSRQLLEEKTPVNDFGRSVPSGKKYCWK